MSTSLPLYFCKCLGVYVFHCVCSFFCLLLIDCLLTMSWFSLFRRKSEFLCDVLFVYVCSSLCVITFFIALHCNSVSLYTFVYLCMSCSSSFFCLVFYSFICLIFIYSRIFVSHCFCVTLLLSGNLSLCVLVYLCECACVYFRSCVCTCVVVCIVCVKKSFFRLK